MTETISTIQTAGVTLSNATQNPLIITSTGGIIDAPNYRMAGSGPQPINPISHRHRYAQVYGYGAAWSVSNAGTISGGQANGVALLDGGSVANSGLVAQVSTDIFIKGIGSVTNSGSLTGNYGVNLSDGGTVTNSGVILSNSTGIYLGGGTVINSGTITGADYGIYVSAASATIFNSGSIDSPNGYAVYFQNAYGPNRLVETADAAISGSVSGGSGVSNTLELAASTVGQIGTIVNAGSFFTNLGTLDIDTGASWSIGDLGSFGVGGTIDLLGVGATIAFGSTAVAPDVILGFTQGETIDFSTLTFDVGDTEQLLAGNTLEIDLATGGSFDLDLDPTQDFSGQFFHLAASGSSTMLTTDNVPCYCSGTLIRTPGGDVTVERLKVGDRVVTTTGEHRPVRWLGHRTLACASHHDPRSIWPIHIAAHAFGENRPERDLFVSPDHSICVTCVEDVLIPASALRNGSTIKRHPVDTVTYWHVELDSHDILIANGLPAESYLEMGNRHFFEESDRVGMDALRDDSSATYDRFCRLFVHGGPVLDFVRSMLAARAERLGWTPSSTVRAYLNVDGQPLEGLHSAGTMVFLIPSAARHVRLQSETFSPDDMDGLSDVRVLGLSIQGLSVCGSGVGYRVIPLDDPRLDQGFHQPEQTGDRLWRWTSGDAVLPYALWEDLSGPIIIHIDVDVSPVRAWQAPAQAFSEARQPQLRLVG